MGSRVIMSAVLMIVPLTMILAGKLLKRYPPPVNGVIGYRTKRSMRDPESWELAQGLIAEIWIKWGLAVLLITLAFCTFILLTDEDTAGIVTVILIYAQMVPMIGAIAPVEKALKEFQGEA